MINVSKLFSLNVISTLLYRSELAIYRISYDLDTQIHSFIFRNKHKQCFTIAKAADRIVDLFHTCFVSAFQ